MTATGVSPTLVLANQLDKLTSTVNGMITTAAMHKEELLSAWKDGFDALPNLVSSHIRDTLEITGAVTVTQADVFRIVTAAFESYASTLQNTPNVPSATTAAPQKQEPLQLSLVATLRVGGDFTRGLMNLSSTFPRTLFIHPP